MAPKRPPRWVQKRTKIDQNMIKNEVAKSRFCDPSHTLGVFYNAKLFFKLFSFIFMYFRSYVYFHPIQELILRPLFRCFFFFKVKGGSGPLLIFFLSLRWAVWGPKVCEGCRFFAFVKVVVDIAFGRQKPPKIDPLKFFLIIFTVF